MFFNNTTLFDEKTVNFFSFVHREKRSYWKPLVIILLVFIICLFPVWPFFMRLVIFYISFYLLIAIAIFSIIRLLLYYVMRLLGYEFWILPDIFENV